jgi:hypothetical protein
MIVAADPRQARGVNPPQAWDGSPKRLSERE